MMREWPVLVIHRGPKHFERRILIGIEVRMTVNYRDRLERSPRTAGGETVIKGTRVTFRTVLASLAEGATVEDIVRDFPTLTVLDVRAAIAFAAASAQADLPPRTLLTISFGTS
jgi:uncharacterized protein (DUF433 family)